MEGAKRFNPFYRAALRRFSRANQTYSHQGLSLQAHTRAKRINSHNLANLSKQFIWLAIVGTLSFLAPIYAHMSVEKVSSTEALSYPSLSIANINLDTPVAGLEMVDRQLVPPNTIAGSYSQNPNKTLIIGHSSTVFKKLDQVRLGNEIHYGDKTYTVTNVSTLTKADVNMAALLASSELDTLVLMTCAGEPLPDQDATHRLIVTAQVKLPNAF